MKRLMLLRHAKSSWERADLPDSARPLSKRGERSAPLMGRLIVEEGYLPDRILCSTAKRATQTAAAVIGVFKHEPDVKKMDELYMATPREILWTISEQSDDATSVLVIGHNPGLGDLADWLITDGDAQDIARLRDKFPTAALAVIDLPIDHWRDLHDTAVGNWSGRLVRFAVPRDVDSADAEGAAS